MAVQQVRAGLKAIYLSGWRVAGDANLSGHTFRPVALPGQLGAERRPAHQQRPAARRRDRPRRGNTSVDNWVAPIVADGELASGGALNVYELQKADRSGAAGTPTGKTSSPSEKSAATRRQGAHPTQQHIRTPDLGPTPTSLHILTVKCRPYRRRGRGPC